jgi:hypothetical protein
MYLRTPTGSSAVATYSFRNSSDTEYMRIDASGNVGIGKTPGLLLDVSGAVGTTWSPNVVNVGITGTASATSGNAGSGITFIGNTTGTSSVSNLAFISGIKENATDGNYDGALSFGTRTNGSGGGNFEKMRITASGNVGIGTSNPQSDLHIYSSTTVSDMRMGNSAASTVLSMYTASNDLVVFNATATGSFYLGTNNSADLTIASDGNVGIGQTSPTYKVDVNGTTVGTAATNESLVQRLNVSATGNNVFEKTSLYRHTAGSDWTGTSIRKQMVVDATGMAYIEYNPLGLSQGIAIATGGTNRITVASDGGVNVILATSAQTASYTIGIADAGKLVEMSNASANNLTVPLNATVAYPIGTQINILQTGAGQTTVVATGGVTINATPGLKLRTQWSSATLIKRATNTWVLVGDLSA